MKSEPGAARDLAVFVNSSDGFRDCWEPFFRLYDRYAPGLHGLPHYLNTERAHFSWPALHVAATTVWPPDEALRPTWSECLIRGLGTVAEPLVLYLHEDYFLNRAVDAARIEEAAGVLRADPDVGVVYLNRYGPQFRRSRAYRGDWVEIVPPARYQVSTQAAVWRKDFLLRLLRPWENGWMFEKFGSRRVRHADARLISLSPELMHATPAIDYVYTGIIKGRWKRECESLFGAEGIAVDFTRRGFYRDRGRLKSRLEVLGKMIRQPSATWRSMLSILVP